MDPYRLKYMKTLTVFLTGQSPISAQSSVKIRFGVAGILKYNLKILCLTLYIKRHTLYNTVKRIFLQALHTKNPALKPDFKFKHAEYWYSPKFLCLSYTNRRCLNHAHFCDR